MVSCSALFGVLRGLERRGARCQKRHGRSPGFARVRRWQRKKCRRQFRTQKQPESGTPCTHRATLLLALSTLSLRGTLATFTPHTCMCVPCT